MRPTFPWHTNEAQLSMTTSSLDYLEQMAKARGAAAGLHGVDDDFAASVDATLHFTFIAQYRALGPEPDVLLKQQEALKQTLNKHTKSSRNTRKAGSTPQTIPKAVRTSTTGFILVLWDAAVSRD